MDTNTKETTLGIFETKGFGTQETLVDAVKAKAAELYDLIRSASNAPGTDSARMFALAKTNLEQAIMWFTKGISRADV